MKREESLGYQINYLARLFADALRLRIAPFGVVPGQFAQLLTLYENDGVTQKQLCESVQIDQSTMAHTLARMRRDDLVTYAADPHDGRRSLISLTDRARAVEGDLVNAAQEVNRLATKGFTDKEVTQCLQLLTRLTENLRANLKNRPGDAPRGSRSP